jgi:hypothetical protein
MSGSVNVTEQNAFANKPVPTGSVRTRWDLPQNGADCVR